MYATEEPVKKSKFTGGWTDENYAFTCSSIWDDYLTRRLPCPILPRTSRINPSEIELNDPTFQKYFSQTCKETKEIPYDIIVRTHELCANYLGGAWNTICPEQINMRAITGGMSNLLFLVKLPENTVPCGLEPSSVLLRIHCTVDLNRLINEPVIFTVLSERLLGPKLFGVFPGGRFEEYIPSRALLCHELAYPEVAKHLGTLMARIHTLDVPIIKRPMIIEVAYGWLKKLESLHSKMCHTMRVRMVQTDLSKCPQVITCAILQKELQIVRNCLEKCNSPILFCHNDLQEGNILLHNRYKIDQYGNLDVDKNEEPLVLIDFEYASYNYRGFDFGNHMCEYMLDYANDKPPFYWIRKERAPSDEQLRNLLSAYVDEIEKQIRNRGGGSHPHSIGKLPTDHETEINNLVVETHRFTAVSHLFWSIWSFLLAEESPLSFDYLSYGLDRFALYYESKPQLLEYLQR